MCCSVLQCVAMCCSVLQCVAVALIRPSQRLRHACCSVLKLVAACFRALQCLAVSCSVLKFHLFWKWLRKDELIASLCAPNSVLLARNIHFCSALQCALVCWTVLHIAALCCTVLQCVAAETAINLNLSDSDCTKHARADAHTHALMHTHTRWCTHTRADAHTHALMHTHTQPKSSITRAYMHTQKNEHT